MNIRNIRTFGCLCLMCIAFTFSVSKAQSSRLIKEYGWTVTKGPNLQHFKQASVTIPKGFGDKSLRITCKRITEDLIEFSLTQEEKKVMVFKDSLMDHASLNQTIQVADLNHDGLLDVGIDLWPGGGIGSFMWSRNLLLIQQPSGKFSIISFDCEGFWLPVVKSGKVYIEVKERDKCYGKEAIADFINVNLYSIEKGHVVNIGEEFGYPKIDDDAPEKAILECIKETGGKAEYRRPNIGHGAEYRDK